MSPLTALLLLSFCCGSILAQCNCPDLMCGMKPGQTQYTCPAGGFQRDISTPCGCIHPSCQCARPDCPYLDTTQFCQYGFRTILGGCPVNRCNERPGPDMVRCPGPNDPTPPPGQFCGVSSNCPIPQICCARWNKRNMCVTGIPIPKNNVPTTTTQSPCRGCQDFMCGKEPGKTPYTCPNGFERDTCGCVKSGCQCVGCPPLNTNQFCRFGYRTRRGCPVNVCSVRPPPPPVRCPGPNENGPIGPRCRGSSDCPPPQICCARRNRSPVCRNGIFL